MKKILILTNYFYPAYKAGGPVRSIKNLVDYVADSYQIDVLSSNSDLGKDKLKVKNNSWIKNGYGNVFYATSVIKVIKAIFSCKKYDKIYFNSFYSVEYSIIPLFICLFFLKCDVILAPRGELTFGAMKIKASKKNIYLRLFKFFRIHKRITFHFTSIEEKLDAIKLLGNVNYIIAPNMHESIPEFKEKDKVSGKLELIFLSRISEKKNLHHALLSIANISDVEINFKIVGPIDDEKYWLKCLELSKNLPTNIKVVYYGAANREEVKKLLTVSQCYILPTLNENYGHAIVEAMLLGNIVILSGNTPWSDVSNHGGYICDNNSTSQYADAIKDVANMGQGEFNEQRKRTYIYCKDILENNERKILNLFK